MVNYRINILSEHSTMPFSKSKTDDLSSKLIVFIGASGSGKDTLLVKCRDQILAEDLNVHIVERWISRDHDETEQFRSITVNQFEQAIKEDVFALHWRIYGNCYGVPRSEIDPYLKKGIVLLNISRAELSNLKKLYPHARVVLIEVTSKLAEERIKRRNRDRGEMLDERLTRLKQKIDLPFIPDLIVKNNSKTINSILVVLTEFLRACFY